MIAGEPINGSELGWHHCDFCGACEFDPVLDETSDEMLPMYDCDGLVLCARCVPSCCVECSDRRYRDICHAFGARTWWNPSTSGWPFARGLEGEDDE